MSNKTQDGGAAFPVGGYCGMTLRDYFAAKAMASLIAKQETAQAWKQDGDYGTYVAELSYGMADAMIAARNRKDAI